MASFCVCDTKYVKAGFIRITAKVKSTLHHIKSNEHHETTRRQGMITGMWYVDFL